VARKLLDAKQNVIAISQNTPGKMPRLKDTKTGKISDLNGLSITTDLQVVKTFDPEFIIMTYDYVSLTSPYGTNMLRELAKGLPDSVFLALTPGLLVINHFMQCGINRQHIFHGAFYFLSFQISPSHMGISNTSTKIFEYNMLEDSKTLFIGDVSGNNAGTRLSDALQQAGLRVYAVLPMFWYPTSHLIFPYLLACELNDWKPPDDRLMAICCGAMQEMSLYHNGFGGLLIYYLLYPWIVRKAMSSQVEQAKPLNWYEFGRIHHQDKVGEQNVNVLKGYIVATVILRKPTHKIDNLQKLVEMIENKRKERNNGNFGRRNNGSGGAAL
jgi:hypothetical protein